MKVRQEHHEHAARRHREAAKLHEVKDVLAAVDQAHMAAARSIARGRRNLSAVPAHTFDPAQASTVRARPTAAACPCAPGISAVDADIAEAAIDLRTARPTPIGPPFEGSAPCGERFGVTISPDRTKPPNRETSSRNRKLATTDLLQAVRFSASSDDHARRNSRPPSLIEAQC